MKKEPAREFAFSRTRKNVLYALAIVGPILMYSGSDLSLKAFLMSAVPMAVLIWIISRAKTLEKKKG
jgi:predicted permease